MRIKITDDEQSKILGLMAEYRSLHDGLNEIEASINKMVETIKEAYSLKEALDKRIKDVRASEDVVITGMIEKYGNGKLNLDDLEWILTNKPKTHDELVENTPE
jgi:hypothetical protein